MTLPELSLRHVVDEDVPLFYEQQCDPVAVQMAAFPPREWPRFAAHWDRIRQDSTNLTRTILVNGEVAGNLGSFVQDDQRFVGYWLGRTYWGQGIATRALQAFLTEVQPRPLFAHVVEHNVGSRRVLEKMVSG
ncbi:GNAT family N-acetyltransferase (plasmid) [Deinococcus sp. KNUC1210]|uniref:GNAT family N-acetyltransferase n=1 Tax=Deinococcus sp. KNUC1210 TaxID=2917691 RepID=UPI001EF0363F|nr:GNAT family N-acetyltransferase [Deinococcus sp. KNUC1210]ULH17004.1 GNAT family N-acetyltransferase [Deinococcus sp. KNUC1210]